MPVKVVLSLMVTEKKIFFSCSHILFFIFNFIDLFFSSKFSGEAFGFEQLNCVNENVKL